MSPRAASSASSTEPSQLARTPADGEPTSPSAGSAAIPSLAVHDAPTNVAASASKAAPTTTRPSPLMALGVKVAASASARVEAEERGEAAQNMPASGQVAAWQPITGSASTRIAPPSVFAAQALASAAAMTVSQRRETSQNEADTSLMNSTK